MSPPFVNKYTPPPPDALPDVDALLSSTEPYDINFALPLHLDTLSCPTVRLTPFVPALHAKEFWDNVESRADELFKYYPFLPGSLPEYLRIIESYRQNPEWLPFAVYDRTKNGPGGDGALAGMVMLINTAAAHLRTEIGFMIIFPEFHHTHVARTAVALLLRYCLQTPTASPPGLGFRRVHWSVHPSNKPSIGLAKKTGFKEEGVLRWMFVLPDVETLQKAGWEVKRKGQEVEGYGRHSLWLSHCWDDWENGGRELCESIIEGLVKPTRAAA
ncbi:acyl-CoA N-acyltransferase [Laetiporus sulphureus 93-53]|uniref:Acyl-CoA N-acyltransferase n=1 Tax=Laetiporus sulphureus 93-53 TaxID=1314785 RepID=A0A165CQL6_9APHY|nr:acyl-CoA N-acyltransferase [Laetiporus sulphureus 93-53]KZT03244.1 acyl-CoA N-acyltransferase [Laetiporus sulphureus 93-53]